jgi:hypothetical protein
LSPVWSQFLGLEALLEGGEALIRCVLERALDHGVETAEKSAQRGVGNPGGSSLLGGELGQIDRSGAVDRAAHQRARDRGGDPRRSVQVGDLEVQRHVHRHHAAGRRNRDAVVAIVDLLNLGGAARRVRFGRAVRIADRLPDPLASRRDLGFSGQMHRSSWISREVISIADRAAQS